MATENTIRIVQTHDARGVAAPAEFEQVVTNVSMSSLGFDAMKFLRPLAPVRTTDPLVFLYNDPTRGSGWLRLEGFRAEDAQRIHELVQVDEISRVVGSDPIPKDDLTVGRAAQPRSSNPWVTIVIGAIAAILGIVIFSTAFGGPAVDSTSVIFGLLFAVLGLGMLVASVIRARWWHRARSYAKQTGQQLPPDLKAGL